MRISVVREDGAITIDGKGFGNLDLSFLPESIHAIQWYGTHGEIEWYDVSTNLPVQNEQITSLPYENQLLAAWQEALAEEQAREAEAALPGIPNSVTMRQGRLALLNAGLLDSVEASLSSIEDPILRKAAQIEWEYALYIDRNSAWVNNLATALNLTIEQLDQLFIHASTL